ncbi:MAG: hypothetical protein Q7S29_01115 [Candidatus Peribacter sp.]|nr:hypothetical protein [Candidatus Peribacter sp.]
MPTTLALVKKEQLRKPEESEQDYQDRIIEKAYWKLHERKNRTKNEDEEYKDLQEKFIAFSVVKKNGFSPSVADADLRPSALRLYKELSSEHGSMTPLKHLLLDRLVAAWSMAASYERLFQCTKYKIDMADDDPKLSYTFNENLMKLMQETRKGIEVANDQIIRLSQALRNLSAPPLHVKVKNAFFAQNQQVNQVASPMDLEKSSGSENNAKTPA